MVLCSNPAWWPRSPFSVSPGCLTPIFQYAMPQFKNGIVEMVTNYPWTFALALFIVSVVVNSQAVVGAYDAALSGLASGWSLLC